MVKLLLFLTLLLLSTSCAENASASNGRADLDSPLHSSRKKELSPDRRLDSLFGYYFGNDQIHSMNVDGRVYLASSAHNRCLVFLEDLSQLDAVVGSSGEGPKELILAYTLWTDGDRIYIPGGKKGRFVVYDREGKVQHSFAKPTPRRTGSTFFVADGRAYISCPRCEQMITVINDEGQVVDDFGEPYPFLEGREILFRNFQHLLLLPGREDIFIAIGESEPVVSFYSIDGKLLSQSNLADTYEPLQRYMQNLPVRKERDHKLGNSVESSQYILFNAAKWYDGALYLLMNQNDEQGEPRPQEVLKCTVIDYRFTITDHYTFKTDALRPWYEDFFFTDQGEMVLYDMGSDGFYVFNPDQD